jgi:hypothetical protein
MLRVEVHDASSTTWLRVEGRFVGAFAEDTKAMVVRCKLPSHLVVDLSELMFVDAEGEEVLLWLARIGAQFVANSFYSLDVCERLRLPIFQESGSGRPRARREDTCHKSG